MKSFKRFLSEEDQGPRDFDKWYTMLNPYIFGESGNINNEGFLKRFRETLSLRSLGSPYVTQTMLDHFDFNGDGIIGQNDIAYGQIISSAIFYYGVENGFDNVPPFMIASEWRQNWESINEQYGFDFPNPDGFFGTPDDPDGNYPDTWNPDDAVTLSVDNLFGVVDGWSVFTNSQSSKQISLICIQKCLQNYCKCTTLMATEKLMVYSLPNRRSRMKSFKRFLNEESLFESRIRK